MNEKIERKLVTFLFTDLEGSTVAWEADDAVMTDAMRRHDAIVSDTLDRHNGEMLKHMGDGIIATFDSSRNAVRAAIALQGGLHDLPIRTRMGVHTGQAEARDGDYFGPEVNRAARVMGIAHGGQILVSEAVHTDLYARPLAEVELVDLGAHRLKGVYRPEPIFQVQAPGLATNFPPLRSLNATIGNLPSATVLIGRDDELAEIDRALATEPVVVLLGPGGVGKTSLAVTAARAVEHLTPDGSWFVDLSTAEPGDVVSKFASTLGISGVPIAELEGALLEYVQARDLRLVVDNCEHLVDEVARLCNAIQAQAAAVRVLATSRIRIAAGGVRSIAIRPLQAGSTDSAAVQLFVAKALEARPGITLDDQMDAIGEICNALDGLPLAIELAASRVSVLSPRDLLARLDKRFSLLRSRESEGRALLATLEWSFELLAPEDRELFVRLGVFRSPFDLHGAIAVAEVDLDEFDLLEMLGRLVDSSLLVVEELDDTTLYRRLESVREFAALKFADYAHSDMVRGKHLDEMERLGTHVYAQMHSDSCRAAGNITTARMADLRAAVDHALATDPARVNTLLDHYNMALSLNGQALTANEWVNKAITALEAAGNSEPLMGLHAKGAELAWRSGDHALSAERAQKSLDMSTALDHEPDGLALLRLATIAALSGDGPSSLALCNQVVRQSDDDPSLESYTLGAAGVLIAISGEPARGMELAQRAVAASRSQGPYRLVTAIVNLNLAAPKADPELRAERAREGLAGARLLNSRFHEGVAMRSLALARLELDEADALPLIFEALRLGRDSGQRAGVISLLELLAMQVGEQRPHEAAALLAGCELHRTQLAIPSTPGEASRLESFVAGLAERLGVEHDSARRSGAGLSVDELVDQAGDVLEHLGQLDPEAATSAAVLRAV